MEAVASSSNTSNPRRAVVLLSGGLDSATVLALAKSSGFLAHALSFDYGQRHRTELECARRLAAAFNVQHSMFNTQSSPATSGSSEALLLPLTSQFPKTALIIKSPLAFLSPTCRRETPSSYPLLLDWRK